MRARPGIAPSAAAGLLLLAMLAPTSADDRGGEPQGLLDIYEIAREQDPQLRGQGFAVEELRESRRESFGRLLPQVTASGEISRTRREQTSTNVAGDEEGITRNFTLEQYGVNLSQPLLDIPAYRRYQGAGRELDQGQYEIRAARQDLISRVAEAYLEVLSAQSQEVLAEREVEAVESSFEQVQGLYDEGLAAVTELEEVRARRDSARAALLRAESDVTVAQERLYELTGQHHTRLAGLDAAATLPEIEPMELDQWVERAEERNPQIQAALVGLDATRHEMRAARAERYPTVSLTAGYSHRDELDGTRFGREFDDLSIGVQVSMPLYQGGQIYARARGAQQRQYREQEDLERTRRGVHAEVRSAFLSLRSARREIQAQQQAVRSNERNVEAMEAGFEAGERPVVDVVDAQRDLFQAERELAELRYAYLMDVFALRRGAGVLDGGDIADLDRLFTAVPGVE